jgi:uncharacterized peroxidase-related enzyme
VVLQQNFLCIRLPSAKPDTALACDAFHLNGQGEDMRQFEIHKKKSAPEQSVKLLEQAESAFGFVPNLLGVLAESPPVLKAYLQLGQIFDESSLSPAERQVAILAVSRGNGCNYCMGAHSVIARMQKVPEQAIEAIRQDRPIEDRRLEALRKFTTTVVDQRGWISEQEISEFEDAGFNRAQVLEVILAISFKTLSNYVNHFAGTPLDDAFHGSEWTPAEIRA